MSEQTRSQALEYARSNSHQPAELRPVILVWIFISIVTALPYVQAALHPPYGRKFVGAFFYVDDFYNYLSYVQQAADGAFLSCNKLITARHQPALLNLEWWAVGRLSSALGGRPLLAYRVFGFAMGLVFLLGVDRWLRAAGLPHPHRLPALLLVSTGGGLGGLLFEFTHRPILKSLDLLTGIFPFIELLANPHFVAGTALLLWSLWWFMRGRSLRDHLLAILLGSILGLVRPYDLLLLVAVRTAAVLLTESPAQWISRLLPLAGLAPVVFYNYWLFFENPAFAFFSAAPYALPSLPDFMWAFGPAVLLAVTTVSRRPPHRESHRVMAHLLTWALLGALVIAVRPVHFSLQFLVGMGVPLLVMGAIGLSRFRPVVALVTTMLFATTAVVAIRLVLRPNPYWYVPAEYLDAARALQASCSPGDIVFSPSDIGLYAAGLTACKAYVSHAIGPNYAERQEQVQAFYAQQAHPATRAALLDAACISHLVLPGDAGVAPTQWLGRSTAFRRAGQVVGRLTVLTLYAREATGCEPH